MQLDKTFNIVLFYYIYHMIVPSDVTPTQPVTYVDEPKTWSCLIKTQNQLPQKTAPVLTSH